MLSDEEKKAIEVLIYILDKPFTGYDKYYFKKSDSSMLIFQAIKIALNLIEKQSKEIEEYKKQLDLDYVKNNYTSNDKIKAKIEELERRIDFLDKELAEAYIMREKLGTETEIDTNEQYIYNMEQERSIRHTQKRVLQSLLEKE